MILTSRGYKKVEDLQHGKDILLDDKNRKLKLIAVKSYKSKEHPYKISKGTKIGNHLCHEDLFVTPNHCVYVSNLRKYIPASLSGVARKCNLGQKEYEYYHLLTPNYFSDVVIANGIATETLAETTYQRIMAHRNAKLILKTIYKACKVNENTFERLRISDEYIKMIVNKINRNSLMKKYN
jgi:hypothetical protein